MLAYLQAKAGIIQSACHNASHGISQCVVELLKICFQHRLKVPQTQTQVGNQLGRTSGTDTGPAENRWAWAGALIGY